MTAIGMPRTRRRWWLTELQVVWFALLLAVAAALTGQWSVMVVLLASAFLLALSAWHGYVLFKMGWRTGRAQALELYRLSPDNTEFMTRTPTEPWEAWRYLLNEPEDGD